MAQETNANSELFAKTLSTTLHNSDIHSNILVPLTVEDTTVAVLPVPCVVTHTVIHPHVLVKAHSSVCLCSHKQQSLRLTLSILFL